MSYVVPSSEFGSFKARWAAGSCILTLLPGSHEPLCLSIFFSLCKGALANRVKRKDTLAMKLSSRPSEPELNLNSWPRKSKEEWNEIRHQIGNTLIRYAFAFGFVCVRPLEMKHSSVF